MAEPMQRALLYQLDQLDGQVDAPSGTSRAPLEALVEQVVLAEQLGVDTVWCLPAAGEGGDFRSGAPVLWLAALARRTRRVRLGWGVPGLTPPDAPPIRVAEQAATLDVLSQGRLVLGMLPGDAVGASASASTATYTSTGVAGGDDPSAPPAGADASAERDWEEGLRMLVEMWQAPRFAWSSKRFTVRPVEVVPRPIQRPHPPIWLIGWSDVHARAAGVAGAGFLDVSGATDPGLELHRDAYAEARAAADPDDLVCESAYAVLADLDPGEEAKEPLGAWQALGIDRVVLRVAPDEEDHARILARLRAFTSEASDVH